MKPPTPLYHLNLLGPFGLFGPKGARIEIASKKGMALIAILAMSRDGVRSRVWLQETLWGSRRPEQAGASLRRELSTLRRQLDDSADRLLVCVHGRAELRLDRVRVDAREIEALRAAPGDFLEGLDLAGEEGFEDWLREQRQSLRSRNDPTRPAALPRDILDLSRPVAGLADRPMLAVLPFANLTGDPRLEYVTEGLAEDLIAHIARLRWLPIVAAAASFAFPARSAGFTEIGRALGARYLVDGRLRGPREQLRLAVDIADAETGEVIWSHRIGLPADPSASQLAPILDEIVGALSTRIDQAEMDRASKVPASSPSVTDLIWRARWHHNRYTPYNAAVAERLLTEALAKDPHSPEAIIQMAYFRQRQAWIGSASEEEMAELRRLAARAIKADPLDGRGYLVAGIVEIWMRRTAEAVALLGEALRLNPSLAYAHGQLAAAYYLNDEAAAALEPLGRALRLGLGEQYTFYALGELAMIRTMLGDHRGAIEAADHAIVRRERYWYPHVIRIHALLALDRGAEAAVALERLWRARPGFEPSRIDWIPFTSDIWPDRLRHALTEAARLWSQSQPDMIENGYSDH